MKLLGSLRSPYVRKVLVVAAEAGQADQIDLELHSVHLASQNAGVMTVNPLGKIPTLVTDDGKAIFDSLVICEFLVARSDAARLLPVDADSRIAVLQRHAMANGLIDLCIMRLVEAAKPPYMQWGDVIVSCDAKIAAVLDALDADAQGLDAEDCTIGTLATAVALNYLDFRFSFINWRSDRDALAVWHHAFSARASIQNNPFEDPAPGAAGMVR